VATNRVVTPPHKNSHTTFLANNNSEPTSEKQQHLERSITSRPSTPPLNPSIAVRVIERLLSNMADWESDDAAMASGGQLTFASSSSTTSALSELIHSDGPRRAVSVSVVGASEGHHHDESHLLMSLQPLASVGMLERLAGDVLVAATVTGSVSPFLTIVDKAIVQRAAGSHSVLQSARASVAAMLSQPTNYFRSPTFLWMWATYASTYSAANCLRTITEQREYEALRHVDSSSTGSGSGRAQYERQKRSTPATLFVGTTIVNSAASLVKDRAYAQMFGGGGGSSGGGAPSVAPSIPRISYLLWMARDLTVIGSSFILPSYVAQHLQDRHGWNPGTATTVAQVATPMAAQLVAGPLHYVGLDCFTRPIRAGGTTANSLLSTVTNRLRQLQRAAPEVITARMVRILPAYGITGVYNTQWRNAYRNYLIESKVRHMIESENQTLRPVGNAAGDDASAAATNRRRATTTNDLVSLIRAKSVRNNIEPQQQP
jgi:uncharacterized membrane protein YgcG